jgi:hypothetical protein
MPDAAIGMLAWQPVVLAAQAVASGAMCGVIWFVQLVHYPLFARVAGVDGRGYAVENQRRTAWVVVPFMLVEGATAAVVAAFPPAGVGRPLAIAGAAGVVALWLSTLAVQMPLHARLAADGHVPATVAALVRSNWPRTILWTFRAILAGWMAAAG